MKTRILIALLIATTANADTITLTYSDNSDNETGFVAEGKLDATGEWLEIVRVAADIEEIEVDPTLYGAYRVAAYNSKGMSGYTNIATYGLPASPGDTLIIRTTETTTTKTVKVTEFQ